MAIKIPFKRGDTFSLSCTVSDAGGIAQDISGWTIRAQLRDGDALVAELDAAIVNATTGTYTLRKAHDAASGPTTAWPVKVLSIDVQYTLASGDVLSTETFSVDCKADITR